MVCSLRSVAQVIVGVTQRTLLIGKLSDFLQASSKGDCTVRFVRKRRFASRSATRSVDHNAIILTYLSSAGVWGRFGLIVVTV